jgi:tetratricopeptide (TPR) repeat protein
MRALFEQAADLPPAEQKAFLDATCPAEPELRARVEYLLACDARLRAQEGVRCLLDSRLVRGTAATPVPTLSATTEQHPAPEGARAAGARAAATQAGALPARLGRYQLLEEIGRGGMGSVLRGHDPELGRDLAVKVLLPDHQHDAAVRRRFTEEAQIGGQLQHPGIVPVHDLGRLEDGRPFIAMKLVQGRTLAELLRQRTDPHQDLPRFEKVFEQVCQTVAYAHSRGVIHRDLKPSNVMVGAFGEVQVMDWGLAKRTQAPEARTQNRERSGSEPRAGATAQGAVMGTPAYMAPEQARGEIDRLDERCDVFGLGGILCEVLTGRPPYDGADDEVLVKALRADLGEALARLDGCGADPELVCLAKRCLAAEAEERPRNAGVLAADMALYRESMEARLRQAELAQAEARAKAQEERKRRRLAVGLVAVLLLLGLGVSGTLLAWRAQRAEQERSVQADLDEVAARLRDWRLAEAHTAMVRAEGRVAGGAPDDLLRRVSARRDELILAGRLDAIRMRAVTLVAGMTDLATTARDYAALFRERGLGAEGEAAEQVAARVRGSVLKAQLLAALDNWAGATGPGAWRTWLLGVARRADPGASANRFRDPAAWERRAGLEGLARDADVEHLSPALLAALGLALARNGADAVPLLKAAQQRHPADFWINVQLGNALPRERREEAVGYYRVALAVRPDAAGIYNNLGLALYDLGRLDEAEAACRRAVALDANFAHAHIHLGVVLGAQGRLDEAEAACRRAVELGPKHAVAHSNLGGVLAARRRLKEAEAACRQALALDPKLATAHSNLGNVLSFRGQPKDAEAAYRRALALGPKNAQFHGNLGNALCAQDRFDEAIDHYQQALRLDPKLAWVHTSLGTALQARRRLDEAEAAHRQALALDPKMAEAHFGLGKVLQAQGDLAGAVAAHRRALALDPKLVLAHANLGTLLQAQGDLAGAVAAYRRALALHPRLAPAQGALGQALLWQGRFAEATETTRRCRDLLRPTDPQYQVATQQLRLCECLLDLEEKLPALLRGEAKPADTTVRLLFAQVCQYKQYYATSARLYTEAFADVPSLAEHRQAGHRYSAACCAARAGCGQGQDAARLDEQDRARWRRQAQQWLRADLASYAERLRSGSPLDRTEVRQKLQRWRTDPQLVGVRGAAAIGKLPAEERAGWAKLWAEAEALQQKAEETK